MKHIPKIAGLAIGIMIALWIMAYWDVREADMLCDIGQAPDNSCQQRFIELERHKHILERTGENPADRPNGTQSIEHAPAPRRRISGTGAG